MINVMLKVFVAYKDDDNVLHTHTAYTTRPIELPIMPNVNDTISLVSLPSVPDEARVLVDKRRLTEGQVSVLLECTALCGLMPFHFQEASWWRLEDY